MAKRQAPALLFEIADWQAQMYVYSCWLYAHDYEPVLSDPSYDKLCQGLMYYYDDTPEEFQKRVSKDNLKDGSSIHLAAGGWREEDRAGAFEWFKRVYGREPRDLTAM